VKSRDNKPLYKRAPVQPGARRTASKAAPKEQIPETEKHASAEGTGLSRTSKEVADIMAAVAKLPDVREEKVRTLREVIRSGAYTPDARRIAERMLEELDLP
jgi:negative regulator of flagellin synthesis FlgM